MRGEGGGGRGEGEKLHFDLRVAADCDDTEGGVQHARHAVRMSPVDFGDDCAALPHVDAAVQLTREGLTGGEKGDAKDLLRGADFAKEAVGALQGLAVPELDELGVRG